jgi:hypothetical protein
MFTNIDSSSINSIFRASVFALTAAAAFSGCAVERDDANDALLQTGIDCAETMDGGARTTEPGADAGDDAETVIEDSGIIDEPTDPGSSDAGKPPVIPPYFASITANGTGCPAGTSSILISDDGKTFVTTFSKLEANVTPATSAAVSDCQLAIKVTGEVSMSFALTDVVFEGSAKLADGQNARQSMRSYFQGNPSVAGEATTEIDGPYDDKVVFQNTVKTADLVWSPCGLQRDLNLRTTLRLENGTADKKAAGYVRIDQLSSLKLNWRRCR